MCPEEGTPDDLHSGVFVPAIEGMGSAEQKAIWLPLAESYFIMGGYAQTELGHG